ncbi:MAG TPA: amidase [Burkholderiaceae bacterium]|nr:amidase [Burkholderiaceae bacterium]
MPIDLTESALAIAAGEVRATDLLDASLAAAGRPALANAFVRRFDDAARATAAAVDALRAAGGPVPPLAGLAVSIKDLFDVAGQPTTAASRSLLDARAATVDAPAVARLRAAGAALVGHTNLTEFAFSGVGINPHHGTPLNLGTSDLDPEPRIPGGSTSGGATSVAGGAAWAALGSDTGGSIRIPAALQGLVGFKSTARLVPTDGCIPLSTTLDTACAITQSVRDARLLHELLAARIVARLARPLAAWRLAVPRTVMLDALDPPVAQAFERSLEVLRAAGAIVDEFDLPELADAAALGRGGGLSAAESWAWHRERLSEREADYDPRVVVRIRRGASLSAADYIDLLRERRAWIERMQAAIAPYDALLSPTVPLVAPRMAPMVASDEVFFATNAQLLRNPSIVNLFDGCALSLPCHRMGDWPVGLMVWAPAMADDRVLAIGAAVEDALAIARESP